MNKTIIEGKGKKNILVLTGIHGNELSPVYIGYMLKEYYNISVDELYFKQLTIVNAINIDGIRKNVREIPSDSTTDLNRMFKSEVKDNYVNEIKQLIVDNDVIIDIHSSPNCTEFILINNDGYANSYVEFAKNNDISYLLRYSNADTIKKFCLNAGKISFTIEMNKMSSIDLKSCERCFSLLLKLFINIDSFGYKIEEPKYETYTEFYHYKEGIFLPEFELGDVVDDNDIIGTLLDLKDFSKTDVIYRGKKAKLICDEDKSYISPGSSIYFLQPI